MTDLVKRLRASVTKGHEPTDADAMEAADEIERLRRLCQGLADVQRQNEETYDKAADEIERLRSMLEPKP